MSTPTGVGCSNECGRLAMDARVPTCVVCLVRKINAVLEDRKVARP